jgi:hydrogenase expression/formation protein HypC
MCLGLVCRVTDVTGAGTAAVRTGADRELQVSLLTLDDPVQTGDWLLVHAGFALARLTDEQATEALAVREPSTEDGP